jgi:sugar/nucleoside kinase (ribokinase family)
MPPGVICLGAVNLDLYYEMARGELRFFQEIWPQLGWGGEVALDSGEEPLLQQLLGRYARFRGREGGGQAANTSYALARMGLPVSLVGRVGVDEESAFLKQGLIGVGLEHLTSAGQSGRAYILQDPEDQKKERTILVAPNTNDELQERDIPWETLALAEFLHFTSYVGQGPLLVQQQIVRRLEGRPRISLDPGELYARRGREALTPLLSRAGTLLVTEKEWHDLEGEMEGHPQWAPPIVLVKRGPQGARLLTPEGYTDFPAERPPGEVIDTVGAGDVFAAGYLAGRLSGLNLAAAVRLAGRAAAYKLTGAGRERYPNREFLQQQLAELR